MERRGEMSMEAEALSLDGTIAACQRGNREAFRRLFEAHQDRVWTIALHYAGDETAAHDIAQQVFLKLFSTIGQFRRDSKFETWLYRLVVNVCLDEKRRLRKLISFDFFGGESRPEQGATPPAVFDWIRSQAAPQEEQYRRREVSSAVKTAVKELKPKLRIAILLKYFEELSYEEMSIVLDCSMGTVASRLNRGHKELARRLAHLKT